MGLFANRAHDDYVSPFDIDDSPAYINPDTTIEQQSRVDKRQYRQEEHARKARRRAEHLRQEHIEQAYYHDDTSSSSASVLQTPSTPVTLSGTEQPTDHRQPRPDNKARGGSRHTTNPSVRPASESSKKPSALSASRLTIAIVLFVVAAMLNSILTIPVIIIAMLLLATSFKMKSATTSTNQTADSSSRRGMASAGTSTRPRSKTGIIIAIVVIGVISMAVGIIGDVMDATQHSSYDSYSSDTADTPYDAYEEREPQTFERAGTIDEQYSDDQMSFTITRAYTGIRDDDNSRTVVVEVEAINEGPTSASMSSLGTLYVFQNGIGLQETYLYLDEDANEMAGYDPMSVINDIKSGDKATITQAFVLRDTVTPLDVRIIDYSNMTTIKSGFTIGDDVTDAPFTQINSSELPEVPPAADVSGMTSIRDWNDTIIADVHIDDASMGPKDYEGHNTVIVTYSWINRSDEIQSMTNLGDVVAYAKGSSDLERAFYGDLVAGYEDNSVNTSILPGVQSQVTIAYVLPRNSTTVNACIEDYDGTVLIERSFTL